MVLTSEDHGTAVVLTVTTPRFDAASMERIAALAEEALRPDRDVYLVDLSRVTFIDSCGVGTLVCLMRAVGRERRLELCGLNPAVRKVFRLTRLDTIFMLHASVAAGLAAHSTEPRAAAG